MTRRVGPPDATTGGVVAGTAGAPPGGPVDARSGTGEAVDARAALGAARCAGCGCLIQRHPQDDPRVPRRCRDCWRRTPEEVIVRESRAFDVIRNPAHRSDITLRS